LASNGFLPSGAGRRPPGGLKPSRLGPMGTAGANRASAPPRSKDIWSLSDGGGEHARDQWGRLLHGRQRITPQLYPILSWKAARVLDMSRGTKIKLRTVELERYEGYGADVNRGARGDPGANNMACHDSTQAPSACCSLAARTTSHCVYRLLTASPHLEAAPALANKRNAACRRCTVCRYYEALQRKNRANRWSDCHSRIECPDSKSGIKTCLVFGFHVRAIFNTPVWLRAGCRL
jgi:hypothetical protein